MPRGGSHPGRRFEAPAWIGLRRPRWLARQRRSEAGAWVSPGPGSLARMQVCRRAWGPAGLETSVRPARPDGAGENRPNPSTEHPPCRILSGRRAYQDKGDWPRTVRVVFSSPSGEDRTRRRRHASPCRILFGRRTCRDKGDRSRSARVVISSPSGENRTRRRPGTSPCRILSGRRTYQDKGDWPRTVRVVFSSPSGEDRTRRRRHTRACRILFATPPAGGGSPERDAQ